MSNKPVIDNFTYWLYSSVFIKYRLENDLLVVSVLDSNSTVKDYITTKTELVDIVERTKCYRDPEFLISRLCASNTENSKKRI